MTGLLLEWMMRRSHRRLCVTVGQWLEPHERTVDVAVGNPVWTMWPCFGGLALLLLGVLAFNVTDNRLWPGTGLGLAGFTCLWVPVLIVPSIVLVETTAGRVVALDASPFRSVPRTVRASLPVADLDPGRWFLGGRIVRVAGTRLWVGSFWARHLPASPRR